MTGPSPIDILLVEDSPSDVRFTREAFAEARIINRLTVVESGEAALVLLRDPSATRPDLILLDLNLPGIDGQEVLAEIKHDVELAAIPVVILTTSASDDDARRAYQCHANCYVTKPVDLDKFIDVVREIQTFWVSIVKLPPKDAVERGEG